MSVQARRFNLLTMDGLTAAGSDAASVEIGVEGFDVNLVYLESTERHETEINVLIAGKSYYLEFDSDESALNGANLLWLKAGDC